MGVERGAVAGERLAAPNIRSRCLRHARGSLSPRALREAPRLVPAELRCRLEAERAPFEATSTVLGRDPTRPGQRAPARSALSPRAICVSAPQFSLIGVTTAGPKKLPVIWVLAFSVPNVQIPILEA
jgi:hypothetical protein